MEQTPLDNQVSDRELQFGYWYTRHRVMIKAVLISVGYFVVLLVLGFNLKNIYEFYVYDEIGRYQSEIVALQVGDPRVGQNLTKPLRIDESAIVERNDGEFDFVAAVTNHNQKYQAIDVAYTFSIPGWTSEIQHDALLPGERKWFLMSSVADDNLSRLDTADVSPTLTNIDVEWRRVKDIELYDDNRQFMSNGLVTENEKTSTPSATIRELSFDVTNTSVYNYRTIEVRAVLYSGQDIVGVNSLQLNTLRSGDTKSSSLRWFYPIVRVSGWDITLSTDVLDENNLLPFTIEQF